MAIAYLNRPEAGSVTGGHILVQRVDGGNAGHLTVLLVHVVSARARVVADPDAEVLDLLGALLGDLTLSAAILHVSLFVHYAPGSAR